MRTSRWTAILVLALVFAAGVAGGVALDRVWLAERSAAWEDRAGEEREERRAPVIERFSEELQLTGGQQERIDTILEEFRAEMKEMWQELRPRYRELAQSARQRIEAELTREQVEKYRELLEEHSRHADGREDRERTDDE